MMNQLPQSPIWVQCIMEGRRPNWLNTTRLLAEATASQRKQMIQAFRSGKLVYIEADDMQLQVAAMTPADQQRLAHVLTFEQAGFQLTAFQSNWALYCRDQKDYWSMQERIEWQWLPTSTIALNRHNVVIKTPAGTLLDIFVPVTQPQAMASFILPVL